MGKHQDRKPFGDVTKRKARPRLESPIALEDGSEEVFVFEALPRWQYEEMRKRPEYRPTSEQQAAYREAMLTSGIPPHLIGVLRHNPVTFPPVLIAACCVSHQISEDEAAEAWNGDDWSTGECEQLLNAAQAVNEIAQRGKRAAGKGSR